MNVRARKALAIAVASILLVGSSGCSSMRFWCWGCGQGESESQVHQVVLVWLKLPGNPTHRKLLIEAFGFFQDSPGVDSVRVGQAVLSQRAHTDDSFDVSATLSFATRSDLQRFMEDAERRKVMADTVEPLAARIVIHDFIEPYP